MKLQLTKAHLENYKNFPVRDIEFSERTEIRGKNAVGKSTLMDAYFDVLTGRLADGTTPDNVRRHDADGKDIDRVDVIREIDLLIDGKETKIRKITHQKWQKPKGQVEEVFRGNETSYEITQGAIISPMKQTQFDEFIEGIAKPETLRMCSNASPFLATLEKSTVKAREMLEKMSGFDLEAFIKSNPEYAEVENILSGHSVEDALKSLRKQLATMNKKLETQRANIAYEQNRGTASENIEVSDLELAKNEWTEKLAALDKQEKDLDSLTEAYNNVSNEIKGLIEQRGKIETEAILSITKQREEKQMVVSDLEALKKELANKWNMAEMDLKHANMGITRHEADIRQAQDDFTKYSARKFDESKLLEIQAEQFDENQRFCPTCKQELPEEEQKKLVETFEKGKQKRIAEQEKARAAYEAETQRLLDETCKTGESSNEALKDARNAKETAQKGIEDIREKLANVDKKLESMKAELDTIPKEMDLSGNADYQNIEKQIFEKESYLQSLDSGTEKRSELRKLRTQYTEELSKINLQIEKSNAESELKENQLAKLEAELRETSQGAANLEKQIFAITNFSIEKNKALANVINPHFHHFQFDFLDYTQEGNPYEVCKLICNGTDYSKGLNHGDRILVEADLIAGFQKMNNLSLPIWIDDTESLDANRIPKTEQQLILLRRTDDKKLTVEKLA